MKILLTNDDGIDAPGLRALWDAAQVAFAERACELVVAAPDRGRSECSHSVTTNRPLKVIEHEPGWFAIDGTPVDCVRAGLGSLLPGADVVIAGVNAGANLGINLTVSGTFAAAREAALHRVPAMAVSQYVRPGVPRDWDHIPMWLTPTLVEFADRVADEKPPLWNVNLPAVEPDDQPPPTRRCAVDPSPFERIAVRDGHSISFKLDFHGRPRQAGMDVDCCFSGSITISEIASAFM